MGHGWPRAARWGTGLATLLALGAAAPAHAGVVTSIDGVVRFTGTASEQDVLEVTGSGGAVVIRSRSVPLAAGAGCTSDGLEGRCSGTSVVVATGAGNDEVNVHPTVVVPVEVNLGPGDDVGRLGALAPEVFTGGDGDDAILGDDNAGGFADIYSGGNGRDSIGLFLENRDQSVTFDAMPNDGPAGDGDNVLPDFEFVTTGDGDDHLVGDDGPQELNGGGGADLVEGLGGHDAIEDHYPCRGDVFRGGAGNDRIRVFGGAEIDGGPGDDTFIPGITCDETADVSGGPGTDTADFSGSGGEIWVSLDDVADDGWDEVDNYRSDIEVLKGGSGGMWLIGGPGPNTIIGGSGDDLLDGGGGADELQGGGGDDVADYSDHPAPVALSLDGVANDGAAGEGDLIAADIESLRGGPFDDALHGDGKPNRLDGGPGADLMDGAGGDDTVDYSLRSAGVIVDLDEEAGDDGEPGERDTIKGVESVYGGEGDDRLVGNAGSGLLSGGPGNDFLLDRGGADTLIGDDGNDAIDSADLLPDQIRCGAGTDELWRDPVDTVQGCETVHVGARPGSPAADSWRPVVPPLHTRPLPPVVVEPPRAPLDRAAPRLKAFRASGRLRRVTLTVRCNEPCRVGARLRRSGTTIARGSSSTPAMQHTVRLALTKAGRKRLKDARYRLELTLTDAAGNRATAARGLKLRR